MRALLLAPRALSLAAQSPKEMTTTLKDQQSLAVTIYNDNLALVKDQREVKLLKGEQALAFQEVSAQIRPETALLRNLTVPRDFWVAGSMVWRTCPRYRVNRKSAASWQVKALVEATPISGPAWV